MENKKSYTPIKVLLSYVVLAALVVAVGYFLYSENTVYNKLEDKIAFERTKILKISKLFSTVYKTESLARKTILSDSEKDFKNYLVETDSLKSRIDTLKQIVTTPYQKTLLDSVSYLLSEKTKNIQQLKNIKNKADDEVSVNNAINEITRMEDKLRKLVMKDFAKNPNELGEYQQRVLRKYVDYLNQNIPDDSTNTLSKKESDSILANSKRLLSRVKLRAEKKKISLNLEENKLLKNEIAISEQLRKVLRIIEAEIISNSIKNNALKEQSLKKVNKIVTAAAIAGLILTLLFSILIISDYSKTQLYKKQLEIANYKTQNLLRSREQLISTVSHDLKTPLSTIVGYTELLQESDLTTKQSYFIKNIKNSSEYITQLVKDLLDFSQIEAGKITLEKVPFSLPEIIEDVAKNVQTLHKHKNIDLIIDVEQKLNTRIVGDSYRLKQVLTNIIGNAYKFTEKGFIKIKAYTTLGNNKFVVSIQDTGIGIEKENQKLVFDEFTQANENIEKKYGGTGLGLSICKKIITILGGTLKLESEFRKGSTFTIELPLLFDSSPNNHTVKKESKPISIPKMIFIVIDDDINLLNLTTNVLRQEKHQVLSFDNAITALKTIQETEFDFIITDIQMPKMDGFLFLEQLKKMKLSNYKNQPIVALTGRSDLDYSVFIKAGFTTVVQKPYSPKVLLETIQSVIENNVLPIDITKNESISTTKLYSLEPLNQFLGDDNETLQEVLKQFIESTNENLVILENAVQENNISEINAIAHRIAPMFRQIEAYEIDKILKTFENSNPNNSDFDKLLGDLKAQINLLFIALKKEIT
ncbi:ATP-binding response regulator [Flavobacterium adhaerens]|uniref:ATP-binding response regulator n=1 Tax=Flavobacterium adhaerens TaxID=3149043 RepID=UPI0032B3BBCF